MAIHVSVHTYSVKATPSGYSVTNTLHGKRYKSGKHFSARNPYVAAVLEVAERDTTYVFTDDDVKYLGEVGDKSIYLVSC